LIVGRLAPRAAPTVGPDRRAEAGVRGAGGDRDVSDRFVDDDVTAPPVEVRISCFRSSSVATRIRLTEPDHSPAGRTQSSSPRCEHDSPPGPVCERRHHPRSARCPGPTDGALTCIDSASRSSTMPLTCWFDAAGNRPVTSSMPQGEPHSCRTRTSPLPLDGPGQAPEDHLRKSELVEHALRQRVGKSGPRRFGVAEVSR
jgi:hypothetical protein